MKPLWSALLLLPRCCTYSFTDTGSTSQQTSHTQVMDPLYLIKFELRLKNVPPVLSALCKRREHNNDFYLS